jgi:hypothetical protein
MGSLSGRLRHRHALVAGEEPGLIGRSAVAPPRSEDGRQLGFHALSSRSDRARSVQGPGHRHGRTPRPAEFLRRHALDRLTGRRVQSPSCKRRAVTAKRTIVSRTREWRTALIRSRLRVKMKNSSVRRTDALGSFWRIGDPESFKAKAGRPDTGCPPARGRFMLPSDCAVGAPERPRRAAELDGVARPPEP